MSGVERFLAVVNQTVNLVLMRDRPVAGFVELDERNAWLRRFAVDHDESFLRLEQAKHLAQRRLYRGEAGFGPLHELSQRALVEDLVVDDRKLRRGEQVIDWCWVPSYGGRLPESNLSAYFWTVASWCRSRRESSGRVIFVSASV